MVKERVQLLVDEDVKRDFYEKHRGKVTQIVEGWMREDINDNPHSEIKDLQFQMEAIMGRISNLETTAKERQKTVIEILRNLGVKTEILTIKQECWKNDTNCPKALLEHNISFGELYDVWDEI